MKTGEVSATGGEDGGEQVCGMEPSLWQLAELHFPCLTVVRSVHISLETSAARVYLKPDL